MDREKYENYIDDRVRHLDKSDLLKIAHILDATLDSKQKLYKDDGLYVSYYSINEETLKRIYDFIKGKFDSANIE